MGFRMQKSMKIAPGVRLNVSKTGVGASVGGRGARYSAHSSGRKTVSAGSGIVPGVYYQKSVSRKGSSSGAAPPVAPKKKPGMFAPKGEKQLYKAIEAQDTEAIKRVGAEHPDFRLPSYSLAGLTIMNDQPDEAERLLAEAFATGKDPAEDKFVSAYLFTRLELSIADGVSAELPIDRDAVGLALAELRQNEGNVDGAIDVVEQLEPSAYAAVSLSELYAQTGRWDDVIDSRKGSRARTTQPRSCAFFGDRLPRAGLPRSRTRGVQGGSPLALASGRDQASSTRRACSELHCPGEEIAGAEGP
jgi:hypothetical protein